MSWDVAVVKIRGGFRPVAEVEDYDYLPLGDPASINEAIRSAFPSAEWTDANQATYHGENFTIDLNLEFEPLLLRVRGTGNPIPSVLKLTESNGWIALDCATSEFIDPKSPSSEGWELANDRTEQELVSLLVALTKAGRATWLQKPSEPEFVICIVDGEIIQFQLYGEKGRPVDRSQALHGVSCSYRNVSLLWLEGLKDLNGWDELLTLLRSATTDDDTLRSMLALPRKVLLDDLKALAADSK